MTIEEIAKALADRNLKMVAERTGVHYVTLSRIRNGHHKNPRYETVKALVDYLQAPVG